MAKRKILVAGCLFLSMFCSAWYFDAKLNRYYVDPEELQGPATQLLNNETTIPSEMVVEEVKAIEKFKPREYVRVIAR